MDDREINVRVTVEVMGWVEDRGEWFATEDD